MPRSQPGKSTNVPLDELEQWRKQLGLDQNATPLDVIRGLWKAVKRSGAGSPPQIGGLDRQGAKGPSPLQTPASSASPTAQKDPRSLELELEVLREKNRLATQNYNIENVKKKRIYWQAVHKGLVPPPSFSRTVSPSPAAKVYCRLHKEYHSTWPCEEVKRLAEEAGAPIPEAERVQQ